MGLFHAHVAPPRRIPGYAQRERQFEFSGVASCQPRDEERIDKIWTLEWQMFELAICISLLVPHVLQICQAKPFMICRFSNLCYFSSLVKKCKRKLYICHDVLNKSSLVDIDDAAWHTWCYKHCPLLYRELGVFYFLSAISKITLEVWWGNWTIQPTLPCAMNGNSLEHRK